jgi:hypothetical protein
MIKKFYTLPLTFLLLSFLGVELRPFAQCTTATVNWDNLDYLERNSAGYSTYITAGMYASMVQTQSFAIGVNRLTITHNYVTANNLGENATNTGEAGSRGTGADVQYKGDGLISVTFDNAVSNASFSIYDIDRSQKVAVTAFNGVTPVNITMAKLSGVVLTILGSGTPAPTATAAAVNVANNSTDGTINVDIAGPITRFVITVSLTGIAAGEDGSFWLSDISACVTGSFPTNYYAVSKPFTGQASYVLAVHDLNTVYMVDPATGRAVSLFTDNSPRVREMNDLAYDPYKHILYYSIDGLERCSPAGNPDSVRYFKKYDFNTETISTLIANVNNAPYNIPTFSYGLESASAAFYNGSLFNGVEGTQSGSTSTGREAIVWRIDFAADSITPTKACQVFAQPVDNGSSLLHDWGDISIKDGVLYDLNAQSSGSVGNYNLFNMQTGVITNTYAGKNSADKPRQIAQLWNGSFCWLHDSIAYYDGTNILTSPKKKIVAAAGSVAWVAGAGDAAEGFSPKVDFGDAPSSYDPALTPAVNERDSSIHIGSSLSWEWSKKTSNLANLDDYDDGLAYVPVFDPGTQAYLAQAQVYNNTGANATVCAWLDYNGNGLFDASEAITPVTVGSSPTLQSIFLFWPGIVSPLSNGSFTNVRIRMTSAANGLTAAGATGYFSNGETEDYRVSVDNFPLSVNLLSFTAKAMNSRTVRLNWTTTTEENLTGFGIERSTDGINWTLIGFVNANENDHSGNTDYIFNDLQAIKGKSYYRLKIADTAPASRFSETRWVSIRDLAAEVSITPNPAKTTATVYITSEMNADAVFILHDMQGRTVRTEKHQLFAGGNSVDLNDLDQLPDGTYIVQIITGQDIITRKLVIGKSFY